ncbi:MAG: hypothetical protein HKN26_09245 [Acidimicrobiales bacterium]|nr:hypothetical protein [Acidimicrobiales bacterium]
METEQYTVLIAAENRAVVQLAEKALERDGRFTIVGECPNAPMASSMARKVKPDLLIVEEYLRGLSINALVAEIHDEAPTAEVIVLSIDNQVEQLDLIENIFAGLSVVEEETFQAALDSLISFWESDDATELASPDRRLRSRRGDTDWNKVSSERRDDDRRS